MTTIEKQRDQLKAYEDHIKASTTKFDNTEKFEFERRKNSFYAAKYCRKILYSSRALAEKDLLRLNNIQNQFTIGFSLGFGISAYFLSPLVLLFIAVGIVGGYIYLAIQINKVEISLLATLHQIMFYEGETKKVLRKGYLRYEQEAYDVENDESFRKSLETEEIELIQDLYAAEVQVAIINEMAE